MFTTPIPIILDRWHHLFPNHQFSVQEFYKLIEAIIVEYKVSSVSIERVSFKEGGMFSSSREYLRISRNEFVFDVCAAPFGTGLYVSYWFGEKTVWWKALFYRIPYLGNLLARVGQMRTYHELDTENMYRETVHAAIMRAVEECTKDTAIRLSESERRAFGRNLALN